jgi:hypothetical protein
MRERTNDEFVLKLTPGQLGEVLRNYGRQAVKNRKAFVMVRFEGDKSKETARLYSVFPEGAMGWNVYPSGTVGGNRFEVQDDTLLNEIEDAVYCGPAKPPS